MQSDKHCMLLRYRDGLTAILVTEEDNYRSLEITDLLEIRRELARVDLELKKK